MAADPSRSRIRFRELHERGTFVMPNAWDPGSARILESLGFEAIATTSSGFAASLGRMDQQVTFDELVDHVAAISSVVGIPINVDAESLYAVTADGVAENVERLADAGAAGISIEDFRPGSELLDVEEATEMVAAAVAAASPHGIVVTARAENHLYGVDDLGDTTSRLLSYREAGADCLYAPGLVDLEAIGKVVSSLGGVPINCLLLPSGPAVSALAGAGVRRISVGGALAFAAYGALAAAAGELRAEGTMRFATGSLSWDDRLSAFGDDD